LAIQGTVKLDGRTGREGSDAAADASMGDVGGARSVERSWTLERSDVDRIVGVLEAAVRSVEGVREDTPIRFQSKAGSAVRIAVLAVEEAFEVWIDRSSGVTVGGFCEAAVVMIRGITSVTRPSRRARVRYGSDRAVATTKCAELT
jgi:hypothetical protein